jgi:hypothetical protein
MSKPTDKTSAQSLFLKAFRENPAGPPPADWPNPGTFRRWLKQPAFRDALAAIRDALRFQADIHVATAAAQAAKNLQAALPAAAAANNALDPDCAAQLTAQLKAITNLLRLAHLRQRFPSDPQPAAQATDDRPAHSPRERDYGPEGNRVLRQVQADPNRGPGAILNDPSRLKSFMLLAARSCRGYDQFLVGFPEELAHFRGDAKTPPPEPPPPTRG